MLTSNVGSPGTRGALPAKTGAGAGAVVGCSGAVPKGREGSGIGNASTRGAHLERPPVCPAQPREGPQAPELNSPDFLGHLNIQEPLQVTVT